MLARLLRSSNGPLRKSNGGLPRRDVEDAPPAPKGAANTTTNGGLSGAWRVTRPPHGKHGQTTPPVMALGRRGAWHCRGHQRRSKGFDEQ